MEISSQLFYQAATLMLVGMGFVYAFLSLLILVIKFIITPLAKYFPDDATTAPRARNKQVTAKVSGSADDAVVAVISAAVSQYRKNQQ